MSTHKITVRRAPGSVLLKQVRCLSVYILVRAGILPSRMLRLEDVLKLRRAHRPVEGSIHSKRREKSLALWCRA